MGLRPDEIKNIELLVTQFKEGCRRARQNGKLTHDNIDEIRRCSDDELETSVKYVPSFLGENTNEIVEYALDELEDGLDDSLVEISVVLEQGFVKHKKKLFGRKEQLDNYGLHITAEWEIE